MKLIPAAKILDPESPTSPILWSGTGGPTVYSLQYEWSRNRPDLHFSRNIFSAFCDAIASLRDRSTGGAPQLATLRRSDNGKLLGFVGGAGAYFKGTKLRSNPSEIPDEFRDCDYQCVDQNGVLLKNAQIQPRPKEVPFPIRKITDIV